MKEAKLKDVGESFGLNVKGKLNSRLEMNAGFDWFSNTSSYPQDITFTGAGTVAYPVTGAVQTAIGPLPDIKNNLLRLKLDGKYMVDKKSDIQVSFIHERWNTNDWSWSLANGSPFTYFSGNITNCTACTPNNGVPNRVGIVDGTSVTSKAVQTANFLGVRYLYKFQ